MQEKHKQRLLAAKMKQNSESKWGAGSLVQKATLLPLRRSGVGPRGPWEPMIDDGVCIPSSEDMDESDERELKPICPLIMPFRPIEMPGLAMRASARSNTFPWKADAKELLCGVVGTVACIAGPRAALWGVIGICVGDMACSGYDPEPFPFLPEGRGKK